MNPFSQCVAPTRRRQPIQLNESDSEDDLPTSCVAWPSSLTACLTRRIKLPDPSALDDHDALLDDYLNPNTTTGIEALLHNAVQPEGEEEEEEDDNKASSSSNIRSQAHQKEDTSNEFRIFAEPDRFLSRNPFASTSSTTAAPLRDFYTEYEDAEFLSDHRISAVISDSGSKINKEQEPTVGARQEEKEYEEELSENGQELVSVQKDDGNAEGEEQGGTPAMTIHTPDEPATKETSPLTSVKGSPAPSAVELPIVEALSAFRINDEAVPFNWDTFETEDAASGRDREPPYPTDDEQDYTDASPAIPPTRTVSEEHSDIEEMGTVKEEPRYRNNQTLPLPSLPRVPPPPKEEPKKEDMAPQETQEPAAEAFVTELAVKEPVSEERSVPNPEASVIEEAEVSPPAPVVETAPLSAEELPVVENHTAEERATSSSTPPAADTNPTDPLTMAVPLTPTPAPVPDTTPLDPSEEEEQVSSGRRSSVAQVAQSILGDRLDDFTEKLAFIKKNIIMSLEDDDDEDAWDKASQRSKQRLDPIMETSNSDTTQRYPRRKASFDPLVSKLNHSDERQPPPRTSSRSTDGRHKRSSSLMDVAPSLARFMNQIGNPEPSQQQQQQEQQPQQQKQQGQDERAVFSPSSFFSTLAGPEAPPKPPRRTTTTAEEEEYIKQQIEQIPARRRAELNREADEEDEEDLFDFTKVIAMGKNMRNFSEGVMGNGLRMFNDMAERVRNAQIAKQLQQQQQHEQQQQQQQQHFSQHPQQHPRQHPSPPPHQQHQRSTTPADNNNDDGWMMGRDAYL